MPDSLCWTIDSGMAELPCPDVAAGTARSEELTPCADQLTDNLFDAGSDLGG